MALLDSQGRLFGKVSVLDVGAVLVVLLAIAGIFLLPGSGVAQVGVENRPIEIDLIVKGLNVADPKALIKSFQDEKKTKVIIRNQPYGEVDVLAISARDRLLAVPQPDGSVKALPDPRPDLSSDFNITLGGVAQLKDGEPVFGNNKVKIGTTLELEGKVYNFNSSVVAVRLK